MSDPLHSSILRAFRGRVGGTKPWLCDDDVVMLLVWMVQMPEYSHSYRSSCDLTFALTILYRWQRFSKPTCYLAYFGGGEVETE